MRAGASGVLKRASAVAVAVIVSACATTHAPPQYLAGSSNPATAPSAADPLEPMNRSVFDANQKINHGVIYPVAKAYRDTVPEPVRDSIDAFTGNLGEPFVFANNLLQLRLNAAAMTLSRFVVNSTLGIADAVRVGRARQRIRHAAGGRADQCSRCGRQWSRARCPVLPKPHIADKGCYGGQLRRHCRYCLDANRKLEQGRADAGA